MFNLLVKYGSWGDGRDTVHMSRMLEYTEQPIKDRFIQNGEINFEALTVLSSSFVEESTGSTAQVARVGTIYRARPSGWGGEIMIEFAYDMSIPGIPQHLLKSLARDLDIADFEFARTHWAVKERDLFRFLLKNTGARRASPKVFQLAAFENIEPSLVSVMMPFDPRFDAVYAALREAAHAASLRCRRADDIWENPAVIQDVVFLIDRSRLVICDCTNRNPNVFYEIGIAHTLGRDVVLITQSESDIPFDLRHLRYVRYLNNGEGLRTLQSQLQTRVADIAIEE
jgi:hypothetical protein